LWAADWTSLSIVIRWALEMSLRRHTANPALPLVYRTERCE
jgi:hypothetical protein